MVFTGTVAVVGIILTEGAGGGVTVVELPPPPQAIRPEENKTGRATEKARAHDMGRSSDNRNEGGPNNGGKVYPEQFVEQTARIRVEVFA